MRHFRLRRPSPALVVACLALIVSLSGTGYAAVVLPRGRTGNTWLVVVDAKTPGAGWSYTVQAVCATVAP